MASSTVRGKIVAVGLLAATLGVGVYALKRPRDVSPMETVPESSFLVANVDLDDLRASPVFAALSSAFGSVDATNFFGYAELSQSCGFDPLTRMKELVVAIPESQEKGEFGLATRVQATQEELATCTRKLAEKRGDKSESHPLGSFTVIGDPAQSKARLAFHPPGTLLVARGAWLEQMVATADNKSPSVAANHDHTELRGALTLEPEWKRPTAVVTVLLPKSIRERIKSEMSREASEAHANTLMNGVLGVRGAGFAVRVGQKGGLTEARLELLCDTSEGCQQTADFLERQRFQLSGNIALRLIGVGPLIDSFKVERKGTHVSAKMNVSADELARSIERAMNFSKGASRLPTFPAIPSPKPDERIVPKALAGGDGG